MTDRETLFLYRLKQAEETLSDAELMLQNKLSPRSITNRIDKKYSKILHKMFNVRLKGDYKELIEISTEDAEEHVKLAREFLQNIKEFTGKNVN